MCKTSQRLLAAVSTRCAAMCDDVLAWAAGRGGHRQRQAASALVDARNDQPSNLAEVLIDCWA